MRYLPLTDADRRAMLATIGVPSVDSLFRDVPEAARFAGTFDLPDHMGEQEVERRLGAMAAKSMPASGVPSFLGAGAYRHHVPASVDHLRWIFYVGWINSLRPAGISPGVYRVTGRRVPPGF